MNLDFNQFVYALVTSTTYGNWLPGDQRGFVERSKQNVFGTPYDADKPGLRNSAKERLAGNPVLFHREHAETMLAQWQKDAKTLHWHLFITAIMANHIHLVVAARKTDKADLLRRIKSRASFALNKQYGKQTWWTTSGSVRFCFDESALLTRIRYVKNQDRPLIVWENPEPYL